MSKKTQTEQGMQPLKAKDEALFEALGKSKKRKKRKILRTVLIIVGILAVILVVGVSVLRRQVRERFASVDTEVLSYEVTTGTISTVVSGSGTLQNVDTETAEIPSGVEVTDVLVSYGDTVAEGDLIATVDMGTVRSAMASLQTAIEELDEQIADAEGDTVSSYIKAGVSGRVKIIYGEKEAAVADVMAAQGALAVLSLDGCMALDLETDALSAGDAVTVIRENGVEINGTVEFAAGGKATVLVTDNGPKYDEEVTVVAEDGTELGSGKLYIHNPLAVTGYAGTINYVNATENQQVYTYTSLFTLTDTSSSANYDSLLRQRRETEETLMELFRIQRSGGVTAPISGSVYSVADAGDANLTQVAVLSPDVSMSVTITVDETDILSLALGQEAEVTVSSVSEDAFTGTVTEIDKSASSGSYTAVVTLDKVQGMLPGMTASVDVRIEGVDDAIIIPVEALHQTSTGAYVYTTYDEELQEYGGRVDVVTGLSNSNYVEIKSGLSVGDQVWYTEQQSIGSFFGNMGGNRQNGGGDFGGGQMPDMGGSQMPDMGGSQRPDAGGGQNQRPQG